MNKISSDREINSLRVNELSTMISICAFCNQRDG